MKTLLLLMAFAEGADVTTTGVAMSHGAREQNPLLPQRSALNLSIQSAEGAALMAITARLNQNHPRIARAIAISNIATEGIIASHNARVIHRLP